MYIPQLCVTKGPCYITNQPKVLAAVALSKSLRAALATALHQATAAAAWRKAHLEPLGNKHTPSPLIYLLDLSRLLTTMKKVVLVKGEFIGLYPLHSLNQPIWFAPFFFLLLSLTKLNYSFEKGTPDLLQYPLRLEKTTRMVIYRPIYLH